MELNKVKNTGLDRHQKRRSNEFDQSFVLFSVFHCENSFDPLIMGAANFFLLA